MMTAPTEAQKTAGNYKKIHRKWYGMDIAIENPRGSTRSGSDANGETWEVKMPADYGYIKRTEGADGDHLDCYICGSEPRVYVINQCDADSGDWDEHKCMLGAKNREAALRVYHRAFSDGRAGDRIDSVVPMSLEEFKDWREEGDTTVPCAAKRAGGGRVGLAEGGSPAPPINPFDLQSESREPTLEEKRRPGDLAGSSPNLVNPLDVQEKPIDKHTGAPHAVRAQVGAAPMKDRLATIRQTYPDAQAAGEDNFIYTDPKTGQRKIYNPEGLDYGDISSLVPEGGEVAGGIAGGVAAGLLRGRPSLRRNLITIPAATGAGAAVGEEGARAAAAPVDTRTPGEVSTDMLKTGAVNAAGAGAGELVVRGIGQGMRRATPQHLRQTYEDYGVDLRTADDLAPQADTVARMLHPSAGFTETEAGDAMRRGVTDYADRVRTEGQRRYNVLDQHIPPDFNTQMDNTHRMLTGERDEMVGARNVERSLGNPKAQRMWEGLMSDLREAAVTSGVPNANTMPINQLLSAQGLPFAAVRKWRSIIGQKLTDPDLVADMPRAMLKDLYGSLSKDLEGAATAAEAVRPGARAAFDDANGYWRSQMEIMDHYLNDVARKDLATQAYRIAMQSPERLAALRQTMPADEWDVVAAFTFRDLGQPGGRAVQGSEGHLLNGTPEMTGWDPAAFMKNWQAMPHEARQSLFAGTRYAYAAPMIDDVVRMANSITEEEFARWAPPAQGLFHAMFGQQALRQDLVAGAVTGGLGHIVSGGASPGFTAAAAALPSAARGIGWALPQLWSSQRFLRWMNNLPRFAADNNSFGSALGQLPAVMANEDPRAQKAAVELIREIKQSGAPADVR